MTKRSKNIEVSILLVMAILYGTLFYYADAGSVLLLWFLYVLILLGLFIDILIKLLKYRLSTNIYQVVAIVTFVVIAAGMWKFKLMDYLDFQLKKEKRYEVIALAQKGYFKPDSNGNCILPEKYSALAAKNTINIIRYSNKTISVEFYTGFGFLGDRSGFLYTNNSQYDSQLNNLSENGRAIKYINNWFKVMF